MESRRNIKTKKILTKKGSTQSKKNAAERAPSKERRRVKSQNSLQKSFNSSPQLSLPLCFFLLLLLVFESLLFLLLWQWRTLAFVAEA